MTRHAGASSAPPRIRSSIAFGAATAFAPRVTLHTVRRLARLLFLLCSGLSVLLAAVTFVVRTFGDHGTFVLRHGGGGFAGGSAIATYALFAEGGWVGLGWTHSDVWFEGTVSLHVGFVLVANAALAAWWVYLRQRRATPAGQCPACGYDLTGNVSGVCPECGTPITPSLLASGAERAAGHSSPSRGGSDAGGVNRNAPRRPSSSIKIPRPPR